MMTISFGHRCIKATLLATMVCAFTGIQSAQAQDQNAGQDGLAAFSLENGNVLVPSSTVSGNDGMMKVSAGVTPSVLEMREEDLPPELQILRKIKTEYEEKKKQERYTRSSIASLLFTSQQYALLREARVGFNTRTPTSQELRDPGDPNDPNYRRTSLYREIRLGGIAYESPDEWTIWLNNARVTPEAIPSEAVDLKVYKDFIELRWHDVKSDQVYPIRLRPNQKFNLDAQMFLPG